MPKVSVADLEEGGVVHAVVMQPPEQVVRTVIQAWGGRLAAVGIDAQTLSEYVKGKRAYQCTLHGAGDAVVQLQVQPPAHQAEQRWTSIQLSLVDQDLPTTDVVVNPDPHRLAALNINRALNKLNVASTQITKPGDHDLTQEVTAELLERPR